MRSDRSYDFEMSPESAWAALSRVPDYPSWWPWLRTFDGELLERGQVWTCRVQPPLPYSVRFELIIDEVIPMRSVRASLAGDIVGSAAIAIEQRPSGCHVGLTAELAPATWLLRTLSTAARPIARFGHDWVLDRAGRQFIAGAPTP
ncbi:MAG: hypothetical protein ABIW84_09805 [Ilumatobacteraceae bacterium]